MEILTKNVRTFQKEGKSWKPLTPERDWIMPNIWSPGTSLSRLRVLVFLGTRSKIKPKGHKEYYKYKWHVRV